MVQQSATIFSKHIEQHFSKGFLDRLAREKKFVQRKSKLDAAQFLSMLMFCNQPQNMVSLEDMANDFHEQNKVGISKQAIQERFNDNAVAFMDCLLKEQLIHQLPVLKNRQPYQCFGRIRVKDSTRYSLPKEFAPVYRGHGGVSGPAQISIQYEYDLITGRALHLDFTSACRNDQQDSKETLHDIQPADLLIRDLGYSTQPYLQHIIEQGAYYVNRMHPRWSVYDGQGDPVDFRKILARIRKHSLTFMEVAIVIPMGGSRVPNRLIIAPVDEKTYRKRMEIAGKESRKRGYKVSDRYKVLAALNLFITNVPTQWLTTEQVIQTYRLRWQIELIFKVWKSQTNIHRLKPVKPQRFQCELRARFLWVLLHWQVLRLTQQLMCVKCSVWKFYKSAYRLSNQLKQVLLEKIPAQQWWGRLTVNANRRYKTEIRKGRPDPGQIINLLLA